MVLEDDQSPIAGIQNNYAEKGPEEPLKLRMLIWEDYFNPSRWSLNIVTSFLVRGRELET